MIVLFGVLEHVTDPAAFACHVIQHLKPGGSALFAVPNCGPAIEAADMSMLIHEHHSYFTERSLQRTLATAGAANVSIRRAGYGNVLYAQIRQGAPARSTRPAYDEVAGLLSFGERIKFVREIFSRRARHAAQAEGGLGIFCPARGLNILPPNENYRFFDDDAELHGRYYPGFAVSVSRAKPCWPTLSASCGYFRPASVNGLERRYLRQAWPFLPSTRSTSFSRRRIRHLFSHAARATGNFCVLWRQ